MLDINILQKLKNVRFLLVEDDESTSLVIKQSLEFYCKNIVCAKDGLKSFERYFENEFIVVTDINLPNLNGLEMLDEIRKRAPHVRSIIIT